mmetsp:Transcript_14103/g.39956  ORF Transcript_14103/g.39956 Transcript_14103/m.39956 type:complete len:243 (-) Transcript_14103:346-1074(-)
MMRFSSSICSLEHSPGLSAQCRRDTSLTAWTTSRRTTRLLSSVRRVRAGRSRRSTALASRLQASALPSSAANCRCAAVGEATSWCAIRSIAICMSSMLATNVSTASMSGRQVSAQTELLCSSWSSSMSVRKSASAPGPAQGMTPPRSTGNSVIRDTWRSCDCRGARDDSASATCGGGDQPSGAPAAEESSGTMARAVNASPKTAQVARMHSQKSCLSRSTLSDGCTIRKVPTSLGSPSERSQ